MLVRRGKFEEPSLQGRGVSGTSRRCDGCDSNWCEGTVAWMGRSEIRDSSHRDYRPALRYAPCRLRYRWRPFSGNCHRRANSGGSHHFESYPIVAGNCGGPEGQCDNSRFRALPAPNPLRRASLSQGGGKIPLCPGKGWGEE